MIRVDNGVYTSVSVDLTGVDFTNISSIVLTVKNFSDIEPVLTQEFTEAAVTTFDITPEQASQIKDRAYYDLDMIVTDGRRYKITENEKVTLREGVGNVRDSE